MYFKNGFCVLGEDFLKNTALEVQAWMLVLINLLSFYTLSQLQVVPMLQNIVLAPYVHLKDSSTLKRLPPSFSDQLIGIQLISCKKEFDIMPNVQLTCMDSFLGNYFKF